MLRVPVQKRLCILVGYGTVRKDYFVLAPALATKLAQLRGRSRNHLRVCEEVAVDVEARCPSSAELERGQQGQIETAHDAAGRFCNHMELCRSAVLLRGNVEARQCDVRQSPWPQRRGNAMVSSLA